MQPISWATFALLLGTGTAAVVYYNVAREKKKTEGVLAPFLCTGALFGAAWIQTIVARLPIFRGLVACSIDKSRNVWQGSSRRPMVTRRLERTTGFQYRLCREILPCLLWIHELPRHLPKRTGETVESRGHVWCGHAACPFALVVETGA